MNANARLAFFDRGVRRLVLTQPPHFRTGLLPAASPTHAGSTKATVHTPKPTKAQAKKIPAGVGAPIAGNS